MLSNHGCYAKKGKSDSFYLTPNRKLKDDHLQLS